MNTTQAFIKAKKLREDALPLEYKHKGDSGMDVYALDDYIIAPGETKLIPTGIKMAIPLGYEIQVRPKSGRALKTKLRVANTPGTVDAGYRDEICVIIESVEPPIRDLTYHFEEDGSIKIDSILHGQNYYINKGEKFAQLVLVEVAKASLQAIDSIASIGENRGGGFGSTGLV
jgi:dUTP pyrophosphatase